MDAAERPDDRTRRIKEALATIDENRARIAQLLRHGIPFGDAEKLAGALSGFSEAYGRFDSSAAELLPWPYYSPPARLTHTVRVLGESPSDTGRNFTRQGQLKEAAERMGLSTRVLYDDWDVILEVRGPRDRLEELARYADEELDRSVELEDDPAASP